MDKKNCWYIDDKRKTLLFLGEIKYSIILNNPSSVLRNLTDDKRYLYLNKNILLKYFSEEELDKLDMEIILDKMFESGENFMYLSKKPRKVITYLGERTNKIADGFIFEYDSLSKHILKFI